MSDEPARAGGLGINPDRGGNAGAPCPPVAPQGRTEANPCHQGNVYCNVADAQSWQQALRELRDPLFDLAKQLPATQASLALEITAWVQRTNTLLSEVDKANSAWIGFVRNTEVQRMLAQYSQGCSLWQRARAANPSIEPLPTPFGTWRDAADKVQTDAATIRWLAIGVGVLVLAGVGAYAYKTFNPVTG